MSTRSLSSPRVGIAARRPRIVLVGGGFAGIACGRTLRRLLPGTVAEIVLFDRQNHAVFHPLLAEVASGALRPTDVAASLRQLLHGVECRTEPVVRVDLERRFVEYESDDGHLRQLSYDQVVIAAGGTADPSIVPGMAEHGLPLRTIGDALAIQAHVMEMLERAEVCGDARRRAAYCSFVVVGGGFSGIEMAGELHDLVVRSLRFFGNIRRDEVRVTVVHARDEILPEVRPALRAFALRKMQQRGIRFRLGQAATACTSRGVRLQDGSFVDGATVVCTIGGKPAPCVQSLDAAKQRGRLSVEPDMSLPGRGDAWAIGDCAVVPNAHDGKPSPQTGQFAERQGKQLAHNIVARLAGRATRPFAHRSLGALCSLGGHQAVAELCGVKLSGFVAWLVWRGVYVLKLPSLAQRVRVGLGLVCDALLPRQLAHVRTDRSRSIHRAFLQSGDFVFRAGDAATAFFVVERGQVEILAHGPGDALPEVVNVLGPGDFFGESALVDRRLRRHSARARTDLEVAVLGGGAYDQLAASLAPMRSAIEGARRRRTAVWDLLPQAREVLTSLSLAALVEPLATTPLRPETPFPAVVATFQRQPADIAFVVAADGALVGVVTRSDLLRAIDIAAARDVVSRRAITVADIMVRDPIALTTADTALVAVASMREHGWKQMPVLGAGPERKLVGHVRLEHVLATALQHAPAPVPPALEPDRAVVVERLVATPHAASGIEARAGVGAVDIPARPPAVARRHTL